MLSAADNARIIRLPVSMDGAFDGRYAVRSRTRILPARWTRTTLAALDARQRLTPVAVERHAGQTLWYFRDHFYTDDSGAEARDVASFVLQRERREARRHASARALRRQAIAGDGLRQSLGVSPGLTRTAQRSNANGSSISSRNRARKRAASAP
jgi:hypothetical protein